MEIISSIRFVWPTVLMDSFTFDHAYRILFIQLRNSYIISSGRPFDVLEKKKEFI